MIRQISPDRILDLGCSDGDLTAPFVKQGVWVTGVDYGQRPQALNQLSTYISCDLNDGISSESIRGKFDLVLLADILEHLAHPESLLRSTHAFLGPDAVILVSVPNFGHWYPRIKVATGRWQYDEKGILDRTHLRFFSIASAIDMCQSSGFEVMSHKYTTTPWELLVGNIVVRSVLSTLDKLCIQLRPNLFAYQTILLLKSTELTCK